jgi:hypothetical protein
MRQFRLNQSTNAVLSALRTARANSVKNFREVRAVVNLDKERIKFRICDGPGDCSHEEYYPGLDWVSSEDMSTVSVMEGVDLYGIRHAVPHDGMSDYHWATSGKHPIEFLPTGTKLFEALIMTYKPNPPTSEPCDYTTIYMGSTGQPRLVQASLDGYSNSSYGAYDQSTSGGDGGPFGYRFDEPPECAK